MMLSTCLLFLLLVISSNALFSNSLKVNEEPSVAEKVALKKSALTFVDPMENMKVVSGSNVRLTCRISSSPPGDVMLMKDNIHIKGSPIFREMREDLTAVEIETTSLDYVIDCASAADVGFYSCLASNGIDSVRTDFILSLEESSPIPCNRPAAETPRIYKYSDYKMAPAMQPTLLFCSSTSDVKWNWIRDGQLIENSDRFEVFSDGGLLIKKVEWDLRGEYTCEAKNEYGSDMKNVSLYPLAPVPSE